MPSIAIVAITHNGVALALQLQAKLPGSDCYVPQRHRFALAMGAKGFDRIRNVLPELWHRYDAVICIMATGIVVRQIARLVHHKASDPAVVVLDEKGRFVISLLSGHLGGANRLAVEVARITGGQPVITTATDVQGRPSLDLIAQEAGLEMENMEMLSRISRAVLEGEPLRLHDPEGRLTPFLPSDMAAPGVDMQPNSGYCASRQAVAGIWVSERQAPPGLEWFQLRPRNLVAGIGCNRGTPAGEILDLLHGVFEREGLSLLSIRNIATIDLKRDEAGLLEAAEAVGRPIRFFSPAEIEEIEVPNPSEKVADHIGVQSVCEATALLSAQSTVLVVPKQKTNNVTLAVARVSCPS